MSTILQMKKLRDELVRASQRISSSVRVRVPPGPCDSDACSSPAMLSVPPASPGTAFSLSLQVTSGRLTLNADMVTVISTREKLFSLHRV